MTIPQATTSRTARRSVYLRRLAGAARCLTTPLLPDDYLGLCNPLWSASELRGRVEAVRPETADAATIMIRPGLNWVRHKPGQWVRIGVDIEGRRHWRTYSLSSEPERPDGRITITVKAVAGGLVSRHLLRHTAPGTIVGLARPDGAFVLPEPTPSKLLFLTAGSGITPVMAMLRSLTAERRTVPDLLLVHSAPTPGDVIFGEELRGMAAANPNLRLVERYTRLEGRFSPADLPGLCPDWSERSVWACGPAGMLDEIMAHWAGSAGRLHVEHFRPEAPANGGEGGRIRFTTSDREAEADGATPLLVVGEEAGVLMPSGCRMGICFSCVGRLSSGRVRDLRTGQVHGEPGDLVQTCVSAAAGPVEIEL
ncbi:ferredoxin reductase [Actinomadura sp. HBU206391]|uniref:ferredoxin reductase n=1 Tax=Actinomadura sp. HBU206391 TaxID=2731692 RepID=UPI002905AF7C|nr:ferredoxin reductase [Actinomadura sp. HBU206391]